ncbi:unnamed protein product [Prorocentrum cordatum]|uniref:Uncharacterized protein n=1 Tax=Prorocentrum cordatum TaxID=2364126 RepID=A0ABN9PIG4_9DINO|nr:unnamed protein product [Polarella glacialis]
MPARVVRPELRAVLADHWRKVLRRLGPEMLVRAALVLARSEGPLSGSSSQLDAPWREQRRHRVEGVLRQLVASADEGRPELQQSDWAALLWATARCRAAATEPVLGAAADSIGSAGAATAAGTSRAVDSLLPSDAARCLWAAATARWLHHRGLVEGAAAAVQQEHVLAECTPWDLSNMAWAVATLRRGPPECQPAQWIAAVASAFARHDGPHAPQAVANILWAVAKASAPSDDLQAVLTPVLASSLPGLGAHGVTSALWAYSTLAAWEETAFLDAACNRMILLLPEADPHHIARAAWAVARLGVEGEGARKSHEFLFAEIVKYVHLRGRGTKGGWRMRWEGFSMQGVASLCWSFVRALPEHKVTREMLRYAIKRVEVCSQEDGQSAHSHANLLWAYSKAASSAWTAAEYPHKLMKRLVQALCPPSPQLEDKTPLALTTAASSLARLHAVLDTESKQAIERWMAWGSRQCCKLGLERLKASEVVVLLKAMASCHMLHPRLLLRGLRDLHGARGSQLHPFELTSILEATALVNPPVLPSYVLDIVGAAVPRFSSFPPRDLITMLWAISRIRASSNHDLEAVFVAGTAALAQHDLSAPEGALAPGLDLERGALARSSSGCQLTVRELMWTVNVAMPLRLLPSGHEGPPWLLQRLVAPWDAQLALFLENLRREAAAAARAARARAAVQGGAAYRLRSAVQCGSLDTLGPRWTRLALHRLGLRYVPSQAWEAAQRALEGPEGGRRPAKGAWLRVDACFEPSTPVSGQMSPMRFATELCAWHRGSSDGTPSRGEGSSEGAAPQQPRDGGCGPLVAVPLAGRDRSHHSEFSLLSKLAQELHSRAGSHSGEWTGQVELFATEEPCLSCLAAAAQLGHRWPGLTVKVGYTGGPVEPGLEPEALEGAPGPAAHPGPELEEAVRRLLLGNPAGRGPAADVYLVGTDPRVQRLWQELSTTGVRPSGPGVEGKKREWHDKLKFFLSHRPHAFKVDGGPGGKAVVILLQEGDRDDDSQERVAQFDRLVHVLEAEILELLKAGRGCADDAGSFGYASVEDLAQRESVSRAWRQFRAGSSDKLGYFLRHCEHFEVWPPRGPKTPDRPYARVRARI